MLRILTVLYELFAGLLAGLWEFPSVQVEVEDTEQNSTSSLKYMEDKFSLNPNHIEKPKYVGEVCYFLKLENILKNLFDR